MSDLDLAAIKRRIAIMRAIPLGPDDNSTAGDFLARDAAALITEVERLRDELRYFKLSLCGIHQAIGTTHPRHPSDGCIYCLAKTQETRVMALEKTMKRRGVERVGGLLANTLQDGVQHQETKKNG